jgi:hypothetical protein
MCASCNVHFVILHFLRNRYTVEIAVKFKTKIENVASENKRGNRRSFRMMQSKADQYEECIEFDWSFLKDMESKQSEDHAPAYVERTFNNLPFEVCRVLNDYFMKKT